MLNLSDIIFLQTAPHTLILSALARSPLYVRGPILKKYLKQVKTGYGLEALACSLHRDLRTWSNCWDGPIPITCA